MKFFLSPSPLTLTKKNVVANSKINVNKLVKVNRPNTLNEAMSYIYRFQSVGDKVCCYWQLSYRNFSNRCRLNVNFQL